MEKTNLLSFVKSHIPQQALPLAQVIYYDLRSLSYVGKRVSCPICGGHFRRFLPAGVAHSRREFAKCPRCDSVERHRLLWLYLQNNTNLFRNPLKVLHFAPEFAFQRKLRACRNLDYTSADLLMMEAMVKVDITAIPYGDNTFDVILCSHVLEHIADDRLAMRELYRVLKSGGWAILLVPIDLARSTTFEDFSITDSQERLRLFGQSDHVRIYGRDYITRLEESGFAVRQDDFARELDSSLVQQYGLLAETIYFCIKTP